MKKRPVFLTGKDLFLSPLNSNDNLEDYVGWLNDQQVTLFMESGRFPATIDGVKEYILNYSQSKNGFLLGIFLNKTCKHIGNITIHEIDWKNRNAKIGLMIGDKKSWGKGYATEVIRIITDHTFCKLNLHKIYAGTISGNLGAKKSFEKVGYKVEGVMKEHFYLNGKYHDCYLLGILENEFVKDRVI